MAAPMAPAARPWTASELREARSASPVRGSRKPSAKRERRPREITEQEKAYWAHVLSGMETTEKPAPAATNCKKCGGTGVLGYDVPPGHPNFGKSHPCDCEVAQAQAQARFNKLFARSGLMRQQYSQFEMADYGPKSKVLSADERRLMASAIRAAECFAAGEPMTYEALGMAVPYNLPDGPRRSLVLYGPPGYGKTSLASAAFRARMTLCGQAGLVVEYYRLMAEIQAQYGTEDDQSYQMVEELATVPLLMLDDLGNEDRGRRTPDKPGAMAETDDRQQKIYSIIDGRYVDDLPMLVTTNLTLEEFADQFGDRVVQRLFERAAWVPMDGVWLRGMAGDR